MVKKILTIAMIAFMMIAPLVECSLTEANTSSRVVEGKPVKVAVLLIDLMMSIFL